MAGALFIDEGVTSEYYMSFYDPESRPYQFGIAMMNHWYKESRKKGMKYCDLDHMWDFGNPLVQRGYSEFKSSIADYDVYFHDIWLKIF